MISKSSGIFTPLSDNPFNNPAASSSPVTKAAVALEAMTRSAN